MRPRLSTPLALALVAGCAWATPPFSPPSSEADLEELQSVFDADPTDLDAAFRLAASQLSRSQIDEARSTLLRAKEVLPGDPTLSFSLGMIEQELQREALALTHFADFLEGTVPNDLVSRARGRVLALRPAVLRNAAEALVSGAVGAPDGTDPSLVAVVPVAYTDETLQPMALGLTDLLARELRGVRTQVVDPEMALALAQALGVEASNRATLPVALEVARLLGAGAVIQPVFQLDPSNGPTIDATVTTIDGSEVEVSPLGVEPVSGDVLGTTQRLAAAALVALGHQWTAADVDAIGRQQVRSLPALQAYGEGVIALSTGSYDDAYRHFSDAIRLDPELEMAVERSGEASAALVVLNQSPLDALVEAARVGERERVVAGLRSSPASGVATAVAGLDGDPRWILPELFGLNRLAATAYLEVGFRVQGGRP